MQINLIPTLIQFMVREPGQDGLRARGNIRLVQQVVIVLLRFISLHMYLQDVVHPRLSL